jgi:hypothetical protein
VILICLFIWKCQLNANYPQDAKTLKSQAKTKISAGYSIREKEVRVQPENRQRKIKIKITEVRSKPTEGGNMKSKK